jgi:Ca2+-binding EF-hand superfamily protein
MKKSHRTITAAGYAALLISAHAAAQAPERQLSPDQVLRGRIQAGATLERYLQGLRTEFLRLDANHDGVIDSADADLHDAITTAGFRTNASMRFMNADLDGDGAVTEAELRVRLEYDRRMAAAGQNARRSGPDPDEWIAQELRNLMAADNDKDGRITWNEMIEHIKKQPGYPQSAASGPGRQARQLLSLAGDGKPSVSLVEIEAAATTAFSAVDSDGNGTISQDELAASRSQVKSQRDEEQTGLNCSLPAASEKSKVVLLGASETDALSSVTVATQDDITGVGNIRVEPGDEPIYLVVVSFQPTIWRFDGAVERIERAVVTTARTGLNEGNPKSPPLAGVTGLPADRVTFARHSGCISFFTEAPSIDAAKAASAVKQQTGKAVALTAGALTVEGFHVSSGKVDVIESKRPGAMVLMAQSSSPPKAGGDTNNARVAETGNLERMFRWMTPRGLIEVEAKSVVASARAEPYEVVPQEAGLIQLMKSGALTQNQRGEFLIHRKIRFPAALSGRHAAKFLLMRGVPTPDGDPGNSAVISEETGEPIGKRS